MQYIFMNTQEKMKHFTHLMMKDYSGDYSDDLSVSVDQQHKILHQVIGVAK